MKRTLCLIACAATLCAALTACGGSARTAANDSGSGAPQDTSKAEVHEFEEFYEDDPGEGYFSINTDTDSYIDGSLPVIYVDADAGEAQLELCVDNFDTSMPAYIYVDGIFNTKRQLTNGAAVTIDISGDAMTPDTGETDVLSHRVEIVQYENDDEDGTVLTYKIARYAIKTR